MSDLRYIKVCPSCKETGLNTSYNEIVKSIFEKRWSNGFCKGIIGFLLKDEMGINNLIECPHCGTPLIKTNVSSEDVWDISYATNKNRAVLDAMIELSINDPIEYSLKMAQLREIAKPIRDEKTGRTIKETKPKCPTCGSTNIEKISIGSKLFGGAMFGLFSSDVRNTMKCKNCGYKW